LRLLTSWGQSRGLFTLRTRSGLKQKEKPAYLVRSRWYRVKINLGAETKPQKVETVPQCRKECKDFSKRRDRLVTGVKRRYSHLGRADPRSEEKATLLNCSTPIKGTGPTLKIK